MLRERNVTADEARIIELENFLTPGSIAYNRPATEAEIIYLDKVEAYPLLAFHCDFLQNSTALVIAVPDKRLPPDEFAENVWRLLTVARDRAQPEEGRESFSVVITLQQENREFCISFRPDSIKGIWAYTPRSELLDPTFQKIPPTRFEIESPGLCMRDLSPRKIYRAELVCLQSYWPRINYYCLNVGELNSRVKDEVS